MKNKPSLYIRVIEFALKYPKGFKYADIVDSKELKLEDWEKNLLTRQFRDACERFNWQDNTKGETIFQFIHGNHTQANSPDNDYILTFEAQFTYIDYQELKFARENAKDARILSNRAIIISIIAIVVSVIVPILISLCISQTVKIDDNQIQSIIDSNS